MQQGTGAHVAISDRLCGNRSPRLSTVEASFIENWGALAKSFGMESVLGRVHALAFLSTEPVCAAQVAETLGLALDESVSSLERLRNWGAVRALDSADDEPWFEANCDPWSWFLATLKERGRREFGPLIQNFREANHRAQQLKRTLDSSSREELQRIERIARFSEFVDQIAGMLETLATLGAGPVMTAMKMVSKMRAPRFARV